jgi:LPXTG-motif cell wall-anchored protein
LLSVRILVALALSLATLPFLAGSASAVGPSVIDIDGNQVNDPGRTDDWQSWSAFPNGNLAEGFSVIRDGVGNGDDTGIDGQEDYNDGVGSEQPWVPNKATASGKSDIGNVLVDSFRDGQTPAHLWAAVGFDRGNGSGTQRYYLEFNQAEHDSIMPTRTAGDLRVILAVNGNGLEECQGAQLWTGTQWGAVKACGNDIVFSVNAAPIDDFFGSPYLTDGKIPTNQFFEVGIDLTALGATSCPVAGFRTFDMRTQEGNENGQNGQLKDVIRGPISIPSDCGTLKIVKNDAATGLPVTVAGTKFSVTPDPTAGSALTGAKTVVDNNTSSADLTDTDPATGKITIANVDPDTYTVRELVAPSGYFLPPPAPDYANCPTSPGYDCLKLAVTSPTGGSNVATFTFSDKLEWAKPAVTKEATGSVATSYTWDIEKTVSTTQNDANATDSASKNVAPGDPATFYYGLKVTGTEHKGVYSVSGKVTVKNPNPASMVVTLSDTLHDGTVCTFTGSDYDGATAGFQANVAPNLPNGTDYAYTCSPSAATPVGGDNTATVTWSTNAYPQTAEQAWATTPGTDSVSAKDGYTYASAGNANKSVSVSDTYADFNGPKTVTWGADPAKVDGNKYVVTFAYAHEFTGDPAGVCTPHVNTAKVSVQQTAPNPATLAQDSATATVCSGSNLTVTKNKVVSLTRTYSYSIDKSVADSSLEVGANGKATASYTVVVTDGPATDSSWAMSGVITVDNPNAWEVTLLTITDSYQGTVCTVTPQANLVIGVDNPNTPNTDEGQRTFPYTCSFASQPPYNGTNTATVTWDKSAAATSSNTASGTAAVVEADWTLNKVNPAVDVVDDKTVPGASNALGSVTWAGAGTKHTFTYSLELTGAPGRCVNYDNTARIVQTGQSDSATVTVCYPVSPTVDKTAGGTYDRTYLWQITKEADQTSVETDGKNGAEVNYTVTATPDGYTDDGWTMNGTITVSNPNDFKSMTVDITDVPNVGPGATCTVTNGEDVVVPAGSLVNGSVVPGTASRDYLCTVPEQPLYQGGTNTAVISWDGGSASSAARPVVFALAGETNKTINVIDDKTVAGDEIALGTATWNDLGTPTEFTYSLELEAAANECETYTNTAEIVETGQFDDVTVEACGPEVLPAEEVRPPVVKGVEAVLPSTGGPQMGLAWAGLGMLLTGGVLMAARRRGRFES